MLYLKDFYRTIQVSDPNGFCEQMRQNCLEYMKKEFKGRNFNGCHVVDVLSVTEMSMCHIVNSNLSADGTIDIKVQLLVEQISHGDLISGLQVIKSDPNVLVKSADGRIILGIMDTVMSRIIREGNNIAVRVLNVIYEPSKRHVAGSCELLTCDKSFITYKITKGLTKADLPKLQQLVTNYKKELDLRDKLIKNAASRDALWFFESLYYSFKVTTRDTTETVGDWFGPKWKIPTGDLVDVLAFLASPSKEEEFYWSRPLEIVRSSPRICKSKNPLNENVVEQPAIVVFSEFLAAMENWARITRELADAFDTKTKIMSQKNIWQLLQRQQS